jgi:serine/threonine protein kinase
MTNNKEVNSSPPKNFLLIKEGFHIRYKFIRSFVDEHGIAYFYYEDCDISKKIRKQEKILSRQKNESQCQKLKAKIKANLAFKEVVIRIIPYFSDEELTNLQQEYKKFSVLYKDIEEPNKLIIKDIKLVKNHMIVIMDKQKRTIGNYILLKKLNTGGMGVIYKAKEIKTKKNGDDSQQKIYALKEFRISQNKDAASKKRAIQEGIILGNLQHPNILKIHGMFNDNDNIYVILDFVPGDTLEGQKFSLKVVLKLIRQIASALKHSHNNNPPIVHRDIKPSNVMLVSQTLKCVLMDFGIAKVLQEERHKPNKSSLQSSSKKLDLASLAHTKATEIVGTKRYLAPETIKRAMGIRPFAPEDHRMDIYGLGLLLYEIASGKKACAPNLELSIDIFNWIVEGQPPQLEIKLNSDAIESLYQANDSSTLQDSDLIKYCSELRNNLVTLSLMILRDPALNTEKGNLDYSILIYSIKDYIKTFFLEEQYLYYDFILEKYDLQEKLSKFLLENQETIEKKFNEIFLPALLMKIQEKNYILTDDNEAQKLFNDFIEKFVPRLQSMLAHQVIPIKDLTLALIDNKQKEELFNEFKLEMLSCYPLSMIVIFHEQLAQIGAEAYYHFAQLTEIFIRKGLVFEFEKVITKKSTQSDFNKEVYKQLENFILTLKVNNLIEELTRKDPKERPKDMQQVLDKIDEILCQLSQTQRIYQNLVVNPEKKLKKIFKKIRNNIKKGFVKIFRASFFALMIFLLIINIILAFLNLYGGVDITKFMPPQMIQTIERWIKQILEIF